MIERFNFYDVFGFLIPGSVLLLGLWLPFGLLDGALPATAFSSALVAVVVAYLIGHFLQNWGSQAFPSTHKGRKRSSLVLDEESKNLPAALRTQVITFARGELGVDLREQARPAAPSGSTPEAERLREQQQASDGRRDAAFLLARELLIAKKMVGYAEQHEALYVMMRGNMIAAGIGAIYLLGWVLATPAATPIAAAALCGSVAATVVATTLFAWFYPDPEPQRRPSLRTKLARLVAAAVALDALLGGMTLGASRLFWADQRLLLLGAAAGFAILALQSSLSYRAYADEFVKAVYRGFVNACLGAGRASAPGYPQTEGDDD